MLNPERVGPYQTLDNDVQNLMYQFLKEYNEPDLSKPDAPDKYIYRIEASNMIKNRTTTMCIDYNHLIHKPEICEIIMQDFHRYEESLRLGLQKLMNESYREFAKDKHFCLAFHNYPAVESIRDLKSNKIGKLMALQGTVTKTTEVRPELTIATFTCTACQSKIRGVKQQMAFTEPKLCSNPACLNKNSWKFESSDGNIFMDWQKIRVQENSNDIPAGSMPRSVNVILRNEQVEKAQPGDRCVFVGTLLVMPDAFSMMKPGEKYQMGPNQEGDRPRNGIQSEGVTGLKNLGVRDINYKLVFVANNVLHTESRFGATINIRDENEQRILESMTEAEKDEILMVRNTPNVYSMLARSLCPMVYGNDEIKKGILLMLFGGIHKQTKEGIKIRGDINVCVVGDPSTAKSQFLKYVHGFLPRCVYTSGRASSAAGLTASVQRDPETGEFTIEAGALMLADNGICCCDEFDKMDEKDQVAIHEAMEQQTISITKAGIQATLNARTSVLAAANPLMGRYDPNKTLKNNLNISAPLMSRFDLFFVVTDNCDDQTDMAIARHIVRSHQRRDQEVIVPFKTEVIQRYIRFARTVKPMLTQEAARTLNRAYVELRKNEAAGLSAQTSHIVTVRQLESLIRLSEAMARVELSVEIKEEHVREAVRLLRTSILKVHKPDYEMDDRNNLVQEATPEDGQKPSVGHPGAMQEEKKKTKMTGEEYELYAKLIEKELREEEQKEADVDLFKGMLQNKLSQLVITRLLEHLDSMEAYETTRKKINAVIDRLVNVDKVLLVVEEAEQKENRSLRVHPNWGSDF